MESLGKLNERRQNFVIIGSNDHSKTRIEEAREQLESDSELLGISKEDISKVKVFDYQKSRLHFLFKVFYHSDSVEDSIRCALKHFKLDIRNKATANLDNYLIIGGSSPIEVIRSYNVVHRSIEKLGIDSFDLKPVTNSNGVFVYSKRSNNKFSNQKTAQSRNSKAAKKSHQLELIHIEVEKFLGIEDVSELLKTDSFAKVIKKALANCTKPKNCFLEFHQSTSRVILECEAEDLEKVSKLIKNSLVHLSEKIATLEIELTNDIAKMVIKSIRKRLESNKLVHQISLKTLPSSEKLDMSKVHVRVLLKEINQSFKVYGLKEIFDDEIQNAIKKCSTNKVAKSNLTIKGDNKHKNSNSKYLKLDGEIRTHKSSTTAFAFAIFRSEFQFQLIQNTVDSQSEYHKNPSESVDFVFSGNEKTIENHLNVLSFLQNIAERSAQRFQVVVHKNVIDWLYENNDKEKNSFQETHFCLIEKISWHQSDIVQKAEHEVLEFKCLPDSDPEKIRVAFLELTSKQLPTQIDLPEDLYELMLGSSPVSFVLIQKLLQLSQVNGILFETTEESIRLQGSREKVEMTIAEARAFVATFGNEK